MKLPINSVIKFYKDYNIAYIRHGETNIWATMGSLEDIFNELTNKLKEYSNGL